MRFNFRIYFNLKKIKAMKHIKLVLAFSVFIISFASNAQIINKAKFLYYQFSMQQYPKVYSDSVTITKNMNDTIWFNTANSPRGKTNFYYTNMKVYKIANTKHILYYNYNLQKNDTFFSEISYLGKDTFIVDSIKNTNLSGVNYKTWHLKCINRKFIKFKWIEGLGDLNYGWNIESIFQTDAGWATIGICLNSNVIYWDSAFNYFGSRNPSPTCAFDSLQKKLKINDYKHNLFSIYPNPSKGNINLQFTAPQTGQLKAYNTLGQLLYKSDFEAKEHLQFDLLNTAKGLVYITIKTQNYTATKVVVIE